ncbi:MAG: MBOAT family protein [Turicibacter sp.]|nr:MBOAT family protein [Turicibacter sp.]
MLCASLLFYAWGEPYFVFVMILSIVFNWYIGKRIELVPNHRGIILIMGGIVNLALLGYYKYMVFAIEIVNSLWKKEILPVPLIDLPIGISFFTFQAIAYIVDIYRGEAKAQRKLINAALYISFFPQLIAGPIVKYKDIYGQIESRIITRDGIVLGFRRFIYGISKKVLISNVLGKSADMIFAMDVVAVSGEMAWSAALFYTFQIYYDFSGYSDMAIGLGKMLGFDIPENFCYPYLSKTIGEFWRKWHISLGTWFRDYVYIPLGGNRSGNIYTYKNLFIVFLLTGLWHGANFTFIAWGGVPWAAYNT